MPVWKDANNDEKTVVEDLINQSLTVINLDLFRKAIYNAIKKRPRTEIVGKDEFAGQRSNILQRRARAKGLHACMASSKRPIETRKDMDDTYIRHMAMELHILTA